MELKESLEKARHIISGYRHDKFFSIYPFSTENIDGYLSGYDLCGKDVLCVGSSSDQAINAFLMGARSVDVFDVNPFTSYYFDLKKACIMAFSYEEFFRFLCYYNYSGKFLNNRSAFSYEMFRDVKRYLSEESLVFWSELYRYFSGIRIRRKLFSSDEYNRSVIVRENMYLREENYYKIKGYIRKFNPSFICSDFRGVSEVLDKEYDYILLSNIANYLESMYDYPLYDFKMDVDKLVNYLSSDGVMFLAYLYDYTKGLHTPVFWDAIYHNDRVLSYFKDYSVSVESFVGVSGLINNNVKYKDSVLVLRK